MKMTDVILKKRQGKELSSAEINFFVHGYTTGVVPDYQAAALLMAIFLKGFSQAETIRLTMAMVESGNKVDLSAIPGYKVDKHSTGGVGDKTTLVLAPLVAAAGVPVAKLAGRGLGNTGGTIDKLEAIPGLRTKMSIPEFVRQIREIGVAVAAQTEELVPADRKMYALRDVTATVDCPPLIASSVMSKKLAAGADGIILDVKVGRGAFLKHPEEAFILARMMVSIGQQAGRKTIALITNMEEPLGKAIGNSLEVKEALATLQGEGPRDLEALCLVLGAQMLVLAGKAANAEQAKKNLASLLRNGQALVKFTEMIEAQGGDPGVIENERLLPAAQKQGEILAESGGYVQSVDAEKIGRATMFLGAGREVREDQIDPSVGVILHKKTGDQVDTRESLATIYFNQTHRLDEVLFLLQNSFTIGEEKPVRFPLVKGVVT